jgi:hypothetical protein
LMKVVKIGSQEFLEWQNEIKNMKYISLIDNNFENYCRGSFAEGNLINLYDEGNILISSFLIFYEFSDWRDSFFWWVYEWIGNKEYFEFIQNNINAIILSLININKTEEKLAAGLRFLISPQKIDIFEKSILQKAHFIVLEKKII